LGDVEEATVFAKLLSFFIAEVNTFVLTAGHDADKVDEPVVIDVLREGD
jgi:hypothetical protein